MSSSSETAIVELSTSRDTATKNNGSLSVTVVQPDGNTTNDDLSGNEADVNLKKQVKNPEHGFVSELDRNNTKEETDESSILNVVKSPLELDGELIKSEVSIARDKENSENNNSFQKCHERVYSLAASSSYQHVSGLKKTPEHEEELSSQEQEEFDSDEEPRRLEDKCRFQFGSDYVDNEKSESLPSPCENSASEVQFDNEEDQRNPQINGEAAGEEKTVEITSKEDSGMKLNTEGEGCNDNSTSGKEDEENEGKKERNVGKLFENGMKANIQTIITSIVRNVNVACKTFKRCSRSFPLQCFFIFTIVLQQEVQNSARVFDDIRHPAFPDTSVSEFHVYPVLNDTADGYFLPDPNLPGITNNINVSMNFGVNLRPNSPNIEVSAGNDRLQEQNDHTRSSSEHFTDISRSRLRLTIRGTDTDSRDDINTRVDDVPNLPSTSPLALDEGNTDTKVRIQCIENNSNLGYTRISQDGAQTTAPDTKRNRHELHSVPSLETVSDISARLSNSVSAQPAPENTDSTTMREERSLYARARTFDARWPHRHLDNLHPVQMAKAGFCYTGKDDIVRCVSCEICLGVWEEEDIPYTEHFRHFPNCQYIRENPQFFGACGQDGDAVNDRNLAEVEQNAASGEQYVRYRGHEQNGRQGLQIELTGERDIGRRDHSRQTCPAGQRRHMFPRGEHDNDDDRNASEMILAAPYEQQYSGIQESGDTPSHTGCTMFVPAQNYDQNVPSYNSFEMDWIEGHSDTDAIDCVAPVTSYWDTEVVRNVLAEGYSSADIGLAIKSILEGDGVITENSIHHMLNFFGSRPLH